MTSESTVYDIGKEIKSTVIKWIVAAVLAGTVGLTGYFVKQYYDGQYNEKRLTELEKNKSNNISQVEWDTVKKDISLIKEKLTEFETKFSLGQQIAKEFKEEQEKKLDRIYDILIKIR